MKLIIELDEKQFKDIQRIASIQIRRRSLTCEQIIANGTPLPKGHGRLIDENELLKMTESYKSELGRLKADPFVKCGIETVENFIKEMPTIIGADKGE